MRRERLAVIQIVLEIWSHLGDMWCIRENRAFERTQLGVHMFAVDRRVEARRADCDSEEIQILLIPSVPALKRMLPCALFLCAVLCLSRSALAETKEMNITHRFLN